MKILQIPPDADIEAIQRAYAHLASQYHPDKVATLAPRGAGALLPQNGRTRRRPRSGAGRAAFRPMMKALLLFLMAGKIGKFC